MTNRTHSSWQKANKIRQNHSMQTDAIDLSMPDEDAAKLAINLQSIHTQITFTRFILFLNKWIIRPVFWWPIKYYGRLLYKCLMLSAHTKPTLSDDEIAARKQWERMQHETFSTKHR